jgi:hypothetical protein
MFSARTALNSILNTSHHVPVVVSFMGKWWEISHQGRYQWGKTTWWDWKDSTAEAASLWRTHLGMDLKGFVSCFNFSFAYIIHIYHKCYMSGIDFRINGTFVFICLSMTGRIMVWRSCPSVRLSTPVRIITQILSYLESSNFVSWYSLGRRCVALWNRVAVTFK